MGDPVRLKYAVLHHTGVEVPHYDLLFERVAGGELVAFRLSRWPVVRREEVVALADHRRVYLTYEGPVSKNRGQVRRVAGGAALVWELEDGWRIELVGDKASSGGGVLRLRRRDDSGVADHCWSVECEGLLN